MNRIKCPHCGKEFSIDDSDYQELIAHIRTEQFEEELRKQKQVQEELFEQQRKALLAQQQQAHESEVSKLQMQLQQAQARLEQQQHELEAKLARELLEKQNKINELQSKLEGSSNQNRIALLQQQQEMQRKIDALQHQLDQADSQKKNELVVLENQLKLQASENEIKLSELQRTHEAELKAKHETIAYYKDFKLKLSTKMIGESLERYCYDQFNSIRSNFPANRVYFEKDNDASEGSKGDFIYRETDDLGNVVLSIMFEMKNEADMTATKHRNEDFFDKLDSDRRKKGCEYAVLVSMLEPESEYYNSGIVDVSYRYDKMYVVRPQCFLTMIALLRGAARSREEYRLKLLEEQQRNIDVKNFEERLEEFHDKISRNFELAVKQYDAAIADLDKAIKDLQKMRENLASSRDHLRIASEAGESITIRKLTSKSPLLKQQFEEEKKRRENLIDATPEEDE